MVMFFNILVFWIHSGAGLMGIAWTLTKFRERPHGIFKGGIRIALFSIIPYSLMASVPSAYLFGEDSFLSVILIAIVTAILFSLMNSFWKLGLRNYSSASS
jgi:ABC-2 type transport system permease protein